MNKWKSYANHLYPAACVCFVIAFFVLNVSNNFVGEAASGMFYIINRAMRIIAYAFCAAQLAFSYKATKLGWFLVVLAGMAALVAVYWSDNFIILDALLLVVCAKNQDFNRCYRISMAAILTALAIIFLLCALSIIPLTPFGHEDVGRGLRYSLGLAHSNMLGYFALYGLWFWMYVRFKKFSWLDILIPAWLTAMIWAISKSRAAVLAILLTGVLVLLFRLPKIQAFQNLIKKILVISPLFCAAVSFLAIWLYQTNGRFAPIINQFFSGRLGLYVHFLKNTPFCILGSTPEKTPQLMEMRENGRMSLMPLDNIYVKTYIYFGLVFMLILLALWVYALRRAYLAGNIPLLIIGAVSAVYGMVEATQMTVILSPILLSAFALYPGAEENSSVPVYSFWALFKPGTWKKAHE